MLTEHFGILSTINMLISHVFYFTDLSQVTFVEIDNECVYDLLRPEDAEKQDLPIKQDAKGKISLQGVNKVIIDPTDLKV